MMLMSMPALKSCFAALYEKLSTNCYRFSVAALRIGDDLPSSSRRPVDLRHADRTLAVRVVQVRFDARTGSGTR